MLDESNNPGSMEAVARGCTCASDINNHGLTAPWPWATGKDSKWDTDSLCPVHGDDAHADARAEAGRSESR